MCKVQLQWQVVFGFVHQPLVVKVREHCTSRLDKELNGHHVCCTGLPQASVLHLDGNLLAVVGVGCVHLWGGGFEGCGLRERGGSVEACRCVCEGGGEGKRKRQYMHSRHMWGKCVMVVLPRVCLVLSPCTAPCSARRRQPPMQQPVFSVGLPHWWQPLNTADP